MPKPFRWIVAPAVVLCLLAAAGASAATLASSGSSPTAAVTAGASPAPSGSTGAADAATVPSGTLSIDGGVTSVQAGTSLTFDYATATANATNWVGVYQMGQPPGAVPSSVWAYAPDASGKVTLSPSGLAPGTYEAWLLYDDAYSEMSAAVTFTVTGPRRSRSAVQTPWSTACPSNSPTRRAARTPRTGSPSTTTVTPIRTTT